MNFFNIKLHNTTIRREILSGASTFIAMSYILSLNPKMLSMLGMNYNGVFLATVLASIITTLIGACYTKMPLAYAPAVSFNIILFPTLLNIAEGDWRMLLLATYFSGVLIVVIVITGIYEWVFSKIPEFIKYSIVAGIGLSIILTGANTLHIVQNFNGSFSFSIVKKEVVCCMVALVIMFVFKKKKKRYAITAGVVFTYAMVVLWRLGAGIWNHSLHIEKVIGVVTSYDFHLSSIFEVCYQFPLMKFFFYDPGKVLQFVIIVYMITITHLLDAAGTAFATMEEIKKKDANFDPDAVKKTMFVNGAGSMLSGCLGTSTVTTYAESMVGIDSGARTGLSAIIVCIGFALSVLFAPLFEAMSGYVVAPAMLYIGYVFLMKIKRIRVQTVSQWITILFIIIYAGITCQISNAVLWGALIYMVLEVLAGRRKNISKYWYGIVLLSAISMAITWYSLW